MQTYKENPCKSFAPNIFNKNKCQNCFKPRETHVLSDKDLNKAKPIYGGWLLLAPIGTDFSNPTQKNRKWQRRWFVLFEHGALRYALDNNETTVAQGTVDMNRCSDVTYAEGITGQKHSLCISLPDQSCYIRGESKEDIMGWHDQLIVYPQTIKEDMKRKKRLLKKRLNDGQFHTQLVQKADAGGNQTAYKLDTSYFTIERKLPEAVHSKDKADPLLTSSGPLQRNKSISTSSLDSNVSNQSLAESTDGSLTGSNKKKHLKDHKNLSDASKTKRISNQQHRDQLKDSEKKSGARTTPSREDADKIVGKERRRSKGGGQIEAIVQADPSNKENNEPTVLQNDGSHSDRSGSHSSPVTSPTSTPRESDERRGRSISRKSTSMKQGTQTDQGRTTTELRRAKSLDRSAYDSIQFSADLFNVKKGWLQIRDNDGHWNKYWFVLGKRELNYYGDSSAEESSNPDGTINLNNFIDIFEWDVQRNYGFRIKTSDETHTFAAMTSGIRRNWMTAIAKSCQIAAAATENNSQVKPGSELQKIDSLKESGKILDAEEAAAKDRPHRKTRVRDRRKEGRSRTFDFAEFRPLARKSLGIDPVRDKKQESSNKSEGKARAKTFDPDSLLKDLKKPLSKKSSDVVDGPTHVQDDDVFENKPQTIRRSSSNNRIAIESEWMKVEKANHKSITNNSIFHPSQISDAASMVRALQSEVDSWKKQMEMFQHQRISSTEDAHETSDSGKEQSEASDKILTLKKKISQQNKQLEKLKQELSAAHDDMRKQSSELRDRDMQLDIKLSEAQLVETQLTNAHNEMRLEKSRREEAEKEQQRKLKALNNDLEESETRLKTTETLHLDAERRIRELERQINMQKNHNGEEEILQEHIRMLRSRAEEQEADLKDMQEAFEERCQNQKHLEDRLSEAKDVLQSYEEQIHEMKEALKSSDKEITVISSHRNEAEVGLKRLTGELEASRLKEQKLRQQMQKLIAQSQVDEDCNKSLQEELAKEKDESQRLRELLREPDSNNTSDVFEQVAKSRHAEQTIRDLRARLEDADKQLRDIEEIRSRSPSLTESSFKAKLTELEAEMGGTGQLIAARLQSLEPSRRVSDPSIIVEKESTSQKIHRLESDLEKKTKELKASEDKMKWCENKLKEMEERENEAEEEFTAKLKELKARQNAASKEVERNVSELQQDADESKEKLISTQTCLRELHSRAAQAQETVNVTYAAKLLDVVMQDVLKVSSGETGSLSTPPRSPSPTGGEKKWGRVTNAESRQQHQKTMSRLRQLTERLKNADGRLVSPSASPVSFPGQPLSPTTSSKSTVKPNGAHRPKDLPISLSTTALTEDTAAQLFAKQISTQALLVVEMAATLRRSQSTPSLVTVGRSQTNYNRNNRQNATSPQLTSAEFSDAIAHHTTTGGLLQHVDTLAQKLTLEGMLMREISSLRESWLSGGSQFSRRGLAPPPSTELSSAMVVHAHINYVLQVYNERISRLSLEAKQARHRADSAMRKLRELVQACKTRDLDAVSNLAVQVDTDSIAPPYSDIPPWEQQVDYGTLHGAQSLSSSSAESSYLDQEADFFHHLADDLKCMSADVQSLSKLGAQLVQTDSVLQQYLQPNEIGEHASTIAREAIVQAEIIYISHRLRRDYDEELRKAKNAVLEQSKQFELLKNKVKQSDENWAVKFKKITEEHSAKVTKLMQDVTKLEKARSDMSKDVEERLTRLSQKHEKEMTSCNAKHEKEMTSCNAKHEQESSALRNDLSKTKYQLQSKTKEYMNEVKDLRQRLDHIQTQHKKEIDETREDYQRRFEMAKAEYVKEVKEAKKKNDEEVRKLKSDFEKELNEVEKEFADKLVSIEAAKKDEIDKLLKKHVMEERTMEDEHRKALTEAKRDAASKLESLKRDYEDLLKKEKSKHLVALKSARGEVESSKREMTQKIKDLKKEHEKDFQDQGKQHEAALERQKEILTKELRDQWDAEHAISHTRSSSMTSENENKDALKIRISLLEEELNSVQCKLEDEQHRHNYQHQLNEIKTLCEQSFDTIEESHAKQREELTISHKRELERLAEEHAEELETNKEDTRRVIEAMRKHHADELHELRQEQVQTGSSRNNPLQADVYKLKGEIETLSEHYSRKCVELAKALDQNEKIENNVKSLERDNHRLRARKFPVSDPKFEGDVKKSMLTKDEQCAGDMYQLEVLLRVKASEIDYLKQEMTSLNKQIDDLYQEKKQSQKKHQSLFDELTLSRSKEGMVRRESSRLRETLRRHGLQSDDDLDSESGDGSPEGYDFQKSRSQPDFTLRKLSSPVTLSSTPSSASVKRRSSDRSSRHKV